MLDNNDVFVLFFICPIVLFGLVCFFYDRKGKKMIKKMKKLGDEHYIKDLSIKLDNNGKEYFVEYFLLKPESYQKVKQTKYTGVCFDIDTAYIDFARVHLIDENQTAVSYLTIPCYKLRNELEQKDLELLQQIKEFNISDKNYAILKSDLEKQLKEKELLKDY